MGICSMLMGVGMLGGCGRSRGISRDISLPHSPSALSAEAAKGTSGEHGKDIPGII